MANGSGSFPFAVDVPRNTRFLFSNKTMTPAKAIAKSIVRFIWCCLIFALLMNCSVACMNGLECIFMLLFQLQVYLLKPGSKSQEQFEKLVNLLEQFVYFHINFIISTTKSLF